MSIYLLVTVDFGRYAAGESIIDADEIKDALATHPEYVLRVPAAEETKPTKAEVRAAGVPPETEVRVEAGLPAGPLPAADEAPPKSLTARTTRVSINDKKS